MAERGGRQSLALRVALTLLMAGAAMPNPAPAGAAAADPTVLDKFVYLPIVMKGGPPPPADIVFHSNIVGNYEIYKMKADGTNVVPLTVDESQTYFDQSPSWVPGHGRIVFQSTRDVGGPNPDGDFEIYVMNADGTGVQRLTDNSCNDQNPSWSPVNGRVAWESNCNVEGGQTDYEIWTMDGTGGDKQQVTHNTVADSNPRWSPGAPARIAFVSQSKIVIMNADGSSPFDVVDGYDPDWSPNGLQLVYGCDVGPDVEICLDNAAAGGGGHVQVTALGVTSFGPVWSPDGATLAFVSDLIDVSDIFTVTASLSMATAGDVHRIPPSFTDAADESGVDW